MVKSDHSMKVIIPKLCQMEHVQDAPGYRTHQV